MKKIYSCFSFLFVSAICLAQPTLTSSTINPTIGQVNTKRAFTPDNTLPGSAGANQVWNWPGLVEDYSGSGVIVNPSTTPYASTYPSATIAETDSTGTVYEFDLTNSTGFYKIGIEDGAGTSIVYDNSEQLIKYPFTYNNTYTDSYHANMSAGGFPAIVTGTITETADAYGTLTTPGGTYTGVLRVHAHEETLYDYDTLGTISQVLDHYLFYKTGIHFPVLEVTTGTSGGSDINQGSWLVTSVGIDEVNSDVYKLSIYPNPAVNNAAVSFTLSEHSDVSISVNDITGRTLQRIEPGNLSAGNHSFSLDASIRSNGIYAVVVTIGEQTATTKMVVTH